MSLLGLDMNRKTDLGSDLLLRHDLPLKMLHE